MLRPSLCPHATVDLGSAGLLFEPGNGFVARSTVTNLKVTRLFGQPIGLEGRLG